jgi:hypothetical protein
VTLFTDPAGWWLCGLALALVLLALVGWRRRRLVSSVVFLARRAAAATPALPRGARRRRQLSFLLASLAIFCLALAGFRPVLVADAPARRGLVVVDLSPSLGAADGGRPRRERFGELLAAYGRLLQREDRVTVVEAGPRPAAGAPLPGDAAARRLSGLRAGDAAADVAGAVALAADAWEREAPDHVVIFTDLPARWREQPGWPRLARAQPRFQTVGAPVDNAGITALELRRGGGPAGRDDLFVRIARRAPGAAAPLDCTVRVAGNGRVVRTIARRLPADGAADLLLRDLALEPGTLEVTLEPPDAWPADNRALAGVAGGTAAGGVRVVLATPVNRFLRDALRASPLVEQVADGAGAGAGPAPPGTVFVYDGTVPAGELPERALFVLPDRAIDGVAPSAYLPPPERVELDDADPVVKGVDPRAIGVRGQLAFDVSGQLRAPLSGDGRPLLLLREDARRRWAVLGFDPAQTAFVYAPSYPVLVGNLLRWLSALADAERTAFAAGDRVALPAAAAGGSVELPDGSRETVGSGGVTVPFARTALAGRYRVRGADGSARGEFFVNVVDPAVTASLARPGYGAGGDPLPPGLERPRLRRELAAWLALAAIGLLGLERLVRPAAATAPAGERGRAA